MYIVWIIKFIILGLEVNSLDSASWKYRTRYRTRVFSSRFVACRRFYSVLANFWSSDTPHWLFFLFPSFPQTYYRRTTTFWPRSAIRSTTHRIFRDNQTSLQWHPRFSIPVIFTGILNRAVTSFMAIRSPSSGAPKNLPGEPEWRLRNQITRGNKEKWKGKEAGWKKSSIKNIERHHFFLGSEASIFRHIIVWLHWTPRDTPRRP